MDVPAWTIALLYHWRWQIELFFRWLKVFANFSHLISHSPAGGPAELLRGGHRRPADVPAFGSTSPASTPQPVESRGSGRRNAGGNRPHSGRAGASIRSRSRRALLVVSRKRKIRDSTEPRKRLPPPGAFTLHRQISRAPQASRPPPLTCSNSTSSQQLDDAVARPPQFRTPFGRAAHGAQRRQWHPTRRTGA